MILRAAYATRGRGGLSRAKAGARYVIRRPSDVAPREYRAGFDADYDRVEKDEVWICGARRAPPNQRICPLEDAKSPG